MPIRVTDRAAKVDQPIYGTKIHANANANANANASRHSALSYEHAGKIETQLKAEVATLMAKAEAADQADIPDGMSIPEELARREARLATFADARAKIEARAKQRFEREQAECHAKLAAREAKDRGHGSEARWQATSAAGGGGVVHGPNQPDR